MHDLISSGVLLIFLCSLGVLVVKRIRMYASNPTKLCWWIVFCMVIVGYKFIYVGTTLFIGSVYGYQIESLAWSLVAFFHINISELMPMFVLRSALRMSAFPKIAESEEFDSIDHLQRMMSSGDKDSLILLKRSLDMKDTSDILEELVEVNSDSILVLD